MVGIACLLCWLAIHKKFEPLLLLPIAIGMLLTNLLGSGIYNELFFAGGHIHWDLLGGAEITEEFIVEFVNGLNLKLNDVTFVADDLGQIREVLDQLTEVSNHPKAIIDLFDAGITSISPGLIDILYLGVKLGIYPCLIFVGVGAMTDFGPLIANPKSLILGAAAQVGIFATYAAATGLLGFAGPEA
ncbi:MAG: sodium ion-translocating decarboxylase subunit beta, partial [Clostridia bacterium]|nr:sodium ion-translocating decarboxylase subunit beta [Clostridia bacterium]